MSEQQQKMQRPPAEIQYAEQLALLAELDNQPRPPGWALSLNAARRFILGDEKLGIERKIVADVASIERMLVTLATGRGLMLVGEPGTAKSMLSELLATAISGTSSLTIQGGASITEDQIKYSWNYAMLINEGPSLKALVPAPLYQGMRDGKIVRFEEITRAPLEVQDCLLGMLSDRVMTIPELNDDHNLLYAQEGFNIIGTANTRDRGVLELLVTTFRDLRGGEKSAGKSGDSAMDRLTAVMSTAEAVNVAHAVGVRAWFLEQRSGEPADLVECIAGTVVKDNADDRAKLRRYFEQKVAKKPGNHWRAYYQARHRLP